MNFVKRHRSDENPRRSTMKNREEANGSPVSVVCSNNNNPEPPKMAPTVVMSDDGGAEVTLSSPSAKPERFDDVILTPDAERERRFIISTLPTHSLMDNECTPSPVRRSTPKRKGSNLWCGGQKLGCYSCDDDELAAMDASMEHTINNFLSSPIGIDEWCTSWQAWTYYTMDMSESPSQGGLKATIKRELRNRAGHLGARASKVSTLKRNLNPFDVTTPTKKQVPFNKASSFCVGSDNRAPPKLDWKKEKPRSSSLASILDACTMPDNLSPFVIRTRGLDDDVFYDSDPEESTKRRSPVKPTRRSRGALTREWLKENDDPNELDFDKIDLNLNDSVQVYDHVQEVMNRRYTLVWHPEMEKQPVAVTAWIERGQQFTNGLMQPRFVWRRLERESELGNRELNQVDLLDISRVLEVSRVDRTRYPLAQRKKCFLMQSLDRKMLFESRTQQERDRLCRDLKIVVARLGSQIIMSDPAVFEEFFVFDGTVPGEAPQWAA